MKLLSPLLLVLALRPPAHGHPTTTTPPPPPAVDPACAPGRPPFFVLAGDSTTAVQSAGGGGWGDGFLGFLRAPAGGRNLGHNGATTVSFVAGGDWAAALALLADRRAAGADVWVTLQFGHNDQKPAKGIPLAQYAANLGRLAADVRAAGGRPVLVTPLTRRVFDHTPGGEVVVVDSLGAERNATLAVAARTATPVLDLNAASRAYVAAIGEAAAHAYNLHANDTTHLDAWGSVVFGRMVADLLLRAPGPAACLRPWIAPDAELSAKIWNGVPA